MIETSTFSLSDRYWKDFKVLLICFYWHLEVDGERRKKQWFSDYFSYSLFSFSRTKIFCHAFLEYLSEIEFASKSSRISKSSAVLTIV